MSTTSLAGPSTVNSISRHDPVWQAFALLRTVFTIAPIAFGLDKFFNLLTDWSAYLAPLSSSPRVALKKNRG